MSQLQESQNYFESPSMHTVLEKFRSLKMAASLGFSALAVASFNTEPAGAIPDSTTNQSSERVANYEASPKLGVTSVTTKNRVVYINGKPVFLNGVYFQKSDWAIDALNVNMFIGSDDSVNPEDLANSVAGRAWVLRKSRPGYVLPPHSSNQIGVDWEDEAPEHGTPANIFKDTTQDGRLNYGNFSTKVAGIVVGNEDLKKEYMPYITALGKNAVVTFDDYVQNMNPESGLGIICKYMQGIKMMTNKDTPVGAYIETTKFVDNGAPLTPEIVKAEAQIATACGATVVNWWDRLGGEKPESTSPEIAAGVRSFTAQVRKFSRYLLAPQIDSMVSTDRDPIKMGGRIMTEQDGDKVYAIILANSTNKSVTINRKLPGLGKQTVKNVINGRSVKAKDGKLKTTIPALGWAIQVYPKK